MKSFNKYSKGFIHLLIPAVLIVLVASTFLIYNFNKSSLLNSQQVLGKEANSGSEDDSGRGSGNDSGKNGSDMSVSVESNDNLGQSSGQSISDSSSPATEKPESTKKPKKIEPNETSGASEDVDEVEDSDLSEIETEFEVNDGTQAAKIKITSGNGQFKFQQEGSEIQVQSTTPLSVNSETHRLTVEGPDGTRDVTILPQSAVDSLVSSGVLDSSNNVAFQTQTDGSMIYKIEGEDHKKFLGIFTISIPKTVSVSSETGLVAEVDQSVVSKILNLLSI